MSSQTENACIATSKCIKSQHNVTSARHEIRVTRQNIFVESTKGVDLTGVLSCRATLFECLRHYHLSLRQVPMT